MQSPDLEALLTRLKTLEARQTGEISPGRHASAANGDAAFRFLEGAQQWRYENPTAAKLFRCAAFFGVLWLLCAGLWWVAGTGAGEATGLAVVRDRLNYAYYGFVWSTRGSSSSATELPITPKRVSGSIDRVIKGDVLLVDCYEGGKSVKRLVRLANVIVTDEKAFQKWVAPYRLKGVMLDFYRPLEKIQGYDVWAAVIWYHKAPMNVEPVEKGFAYPEKNPPTTVVNQIFSQYYWSLAKG